MTTADVLGAMRRCWYALVVGLFLTGMVVGLVASRPGVYTTRAEVVLVPPKAYAAIGGTLISSSDSLIATTGLVERLVNADLPHRAPTNQIVDLAGTGVRHGVSIRQANAGGQWDFNFTSPLLVVQAVGSDSASVARARARAVNRIANTLRRIQDEQGVRPQQRITTQLVPASVPVVYRQGHPQRAALATGALCLILTGLLVVGLDQVVGRRRRRLDSRAGTDGDTGAASTEAPWQQQTS